MTFPQKNTTEKSTIFMQKQRFSSLFYAIHRKTTDVLKSIRTFYQNKNYHIFRLK